MTWALRFLSVGVSLGVAFAAGCHSVTARPVARAASSPAADAAVDEALLDPRTRPCDDFYKYACGRWYGDASRVEIINDEHAKTLASLLDAFARGEGPGVPYAKTLGDFYASCMNDSGADARAVLDATKTELALIDTVTDDASFARALAALHKIGHTGPFELTPSDDLTNEGVAIARIGQTWFSLEGEEPLTGHSLARFVRDDDESKRARAAALAWIVGVFTAMGEDAAQAQRHAQAAFGIERALGTSLLDKDENVAPRHLKIERAALRRLAPRFAWDLYFREMGMGVSTAIDANSPELVERINALLGTVPLADWKAYLRYRALSGSVWALGFVTSSGETEAQPRSIRCMRMTEAMMPSALGHAFLKATLPSGAEAGFSKIRGAVTRAMRLELLKLAWMDDDTRQRLSEKLASIHVVVPHADAQNIEEIPLVRGSFIANMRSVHAFQKTAALASIGKPPSRSETRPPFRVAAQISANYDSARNEVIIPAVLLEPPFYGENRPSATTDPALGEFLGHELTHAFDSSHWQRDAEGTLSEAWPAIVKEPFTQRDECVEEQYSHYLLPDGTRVDAKKTLDENIADLGGIKLAFAVFEASRDRDRMPITDRYSPEQRFFLAFAQLWCGAHADDYVRSPVKDESHAPVRFRVNGPLSNMSDFARAFSCKSGDTMVREGASRCEPW